MKINHIFKTFLSVILISVITFGFSFKSDANTVSSNDLVILQKALLNVIKYDSSWLDTNGDTVFDIKDLIRVKKFLTDNNTEITPIRYVDITINSGENDSVLRIYSPKVQLPLLQSPYNYWKIGNSYYSANDSVFIYSDTRITAVKNKNEIDFPIIKWFFVNSWGKELK